MGRLTDKGKVHSFIILSVIYAGIGFFIYSPGLDAPFYLDDFRRIVDNPEIRDLSIILKPLRHRYTSYVTFALNYIIGGMTPFPYRIVNVMIHTVNALLVYGITSNVLRITGSDSGSARRFVPLVASILFLVHPVESSAVTYIVQRVASLATLFYLLAVYSYLRWKGEGRGYTSAWYFVSIIASLLGMRSKEIVFTLPVLLLLLEWILFSGSWRMRLTGIIPFFLTMTFIPIEFLMRSAGGNLVSAIGHAATVMSEGVTIPRDVYFLTEMRVIVTYLRLLFYPLNQRLIYDYHQFSSIEEPEVMLSMIMHFLIITVAIISLIVLRRKQIKGSSILIPLGILWFYLALSVESSIISLPHLIFEHRVYLPSAGFFMAVGALLYLLYRSGYMRYPVIATLIVVVITLSVLTYRRNALWADDLLFWKDNAKKTMRAVAPHYYLAKAYTERGLYMKAIEEYNLAAILGPDYPEIHLAMAETYEKMNYIADARREYQKVVEISPRDYRGYLGLGRCSLKEGDLKRAEENLKKAGMLNPYDRGVLMLWKQLKELSGGKSIHER